LLTLQYAKLNIRCYKLLSRILCKYTHIEISQTSLTILPCSHRSAPGRETCFAGWFAKFARPW